jgi:hypothetical protein
MQIALQALRHRQLPQQIALLGDAEDVSDAPGLEFILQPQTLVRIRHMGKFGADGPRVDLLEVRQDVAQLHLGWGSPQCGCR